MKRTKIFLLLIIIAAIQSMLTGCWNYKEIDKLAIVAGVAIDKDTDGQYLVTAEIVQISGGKDSKTLSKPISMKGKTVFDAVRNGVSLTGKRLYWSHSKVIILSKDIASEGLKKILDWYIRDAESREDVNILISNGESAREMFEGEGITEDIKSFKLDETIKNQDSFSKAPLTDVLKYSIEIQTDGMSTVIPAINLKKSDKKMVPQIIGAAIIKDDKLAGFLNDEETKALNFIRNDIKGGILVGITQENSTPISLEIFYSKTTVTPVIDVTGIKFNLNIETTVAIGEIEGSENVIEEEERKKLEQSTEKKLKEHIETLIKKVQSEYDADIFEFSSKLHEDKSNVWKKVSSNWEQIFKDLPVNVKTKVHIKNSAVLSKPLEESDY